MDETGRIIIRHDRWQQVSPQRSLNQERMTVQRKGEAMEKLSQAFSNESDDHKAKAKDFVERYTTGDPTEGYTDEEARQMAAAVLPRLSPDQLQQALAASAKNIETNGKESDRSALAQMMRQREAGKGMVDITRTGENTAAGGPAQQQSDDDMLGGLLGGLLGGGQSSGQGGTDLGGLLGGLLGGGQSSGQGGTDLGGLLGGLLGGGGGGSAASIDDIFGAPKEKSGAVPADRQVEDAGGIGNMLGGLMDSPATKALIAGAAAYAMKELLDI